MDSSERVSIRPGVGILSVLRHLNYKPWFAIAEFVDNSLQSYLRNRDALSRSESNYKLRVEIAVDRSDEMRILIRDNAAGISTVDYPRAFRPAEIPLETTGLSEFGMGMKSAACWFAPRWQVRTCALGEYIERTITFDIATIVRDALEELNVVDSPAKPGSHFTEVTLLDPYNRLLTRTSSKIKDHLASIYRIFLREKALDLVFDGTHLVYEMPEVLVYPYFKTPEGAAQRWHKEFDFDFGKGLRAHGFAALRQVANTATAGFALFRRKRLIEGSWDEPYRPDLIFGSGNTYRKQRLFGEIHLESFEVSHTKDGFRWEDHELPFLELLREQLESESLPMLSQAEGFRARGVHQPAALKAEAEKANRRVAETLAKEVPPILDSQSALPPVTYPPPQNLPPHAGTASRSIEIIHRGTPWRIIIELTLDPSVADWISLSDKPSTKSAPREITVRMSLAHPFMERYCRPESAEIEALERIAAAMGLAEVTARDSGVPQYGTIRRNINQLLREALSKP